MSLFSPNSRIFGLEIGTHSLRTISVKRSYFGLKIESVNEQPLDQSPWLKNGIRNKEELARKVQTMILNAKPRPIHLTQVVSCLPETSVFSKVIVLPKLSKKELQQTIPFEAAEFLPLPIEEMYLDWQIHTHAGATKEDTSTHVFLVAAPKKLVDDLMLVCQNAGLILNHLESQPFALTRSLIGQLDNEEIRAILDIDEKITTLVLATEDSIKLTATVAIGSHQLKKNLALQTRQLADEISEGINYYHNRLGEKMSVDRLILSGQAAMIKGLAEAIQAATKIPCQIGYPALSLPKQQLIHPRFNTVIGLALTQPKKESQ